MRINFLEKKSSFLKNRADVLFMVFLLIGLGSFHLALMNDTGEKMSVLQERISFLKKEIQENNRIKRKLKELKQTEAEIARKSSLLRMLKERKSVPPLVKYFAEKGTPKGVWLTELAIDRGNIEVKGGTENINGLIRLVNELKSFGVFHLESITKDKVSFQKLKKTFEYYKFSLKNSP
jgi:Tfp pilus assembly protein PilN